MVIRCVSCKTYNYDFKDQNLTFHKVPDQPEIRSEWLSLLGISEHSKPLAKVLHLCSNHFYPSDFIVGSKRLKTGALPHPANLPANPGSNENDNADYPSTSKLSDSSDTDTASEPLGNPQLCKIAVIGSVKKRVTERLSDVSLGIKPLHWSSDTLTASDEDPSTTTAIQAPMPVAVSRKRKRYIGDMRSEDFATPRRAKANFYIAKKISCRQRKQIKALNQRVRRLRAKIYEIHTLTKMLNQKGHLSETAEPVVNASVPDAAKAVFARFLKGPSTKKYDPVLRTFALTLNFYSPKAYNYVRNVFNKTLPHPRTISRWYQSVNGAPGFTEEASTALKLKVSEAATKNKEVVCNLVFDEMSVRQQIEWTGEQFTGYVDIGSKMDSDELPEAKEVLVFMLVALNDSWKIPVGYFFLDGLSGKEKAGLVNRCLEFVHQSGVKVRSLTFDGAAANFTMATTLGADFTNMDNLQTSFPHPITKKPVYIFLDPCHMIKLVRNCLGSVGAIVDGDNKSVKWNYLNKLVEHQDKEGLVAANKLKHRHIEWTKEKMRVKLATQTLSKSVSDALLYLSKKEIPDFKGAEATSKFILIFNNLFDIFNSRNRLAKYQYQKPLSQKNHLEILEFFDTTKDYIKSLKIDSTPILNSKRKTGFLGFLICGELKKSIPCYGSRRKMFKISVNVQNIARSP